MSGITDHTPPPMPRPRFETRSEADPEPTEWKILHPGRIGIPGTSFSIEHERLLNNPFVAWRADHLIWDKSFATLEAAKAAVEQYRKELREIGLPNE